MLIAVDQPERPRQDLIKKAWEAPDRVDSAFAY